MMDFKFLGKLIFGFICGVALSHFGVAGEKLESKNDSDTKIVAALQSRFLGAKIDILPGSTFPQCAETCEVKNVSLIQENGNGSADFRVQLKDEPNAIKFARVNFNASVSAWIAKRRIRPGERLSSADFEKQSIDISKGLAYQYRGMMLKEGVDLNSLQARLTILEGQYPLSNGVEKVPNVRKGDVVQVKLTSGDIQLMTQAVAQESGFEDQKIRVITQKGKRELTGMLKEGGTVEVRL